MRGLFTVLGLLLVVAIVGLLAKRQFSEMGRVAVPATPVAVPAGGAAVPGGTPQQQVRQVEQAVQGLMQQARPMPEDK